MSEELKPLAIRHFWERINKTPSCWFWTGYIKPGDVKYGILTMNRKSLRAHRFSWILHFGKIAKDKCVLHKCDEGTCVRPDHLFLGTRIDNNLDRDRKGRAHSVSGSKNGKSKLTETQVQLIKTKINSGFSFAALGKEFGVRWQTIQAIKKGLTWKMI